MTVQVLDTRYQGRFSLIPGQNPKNLYDYFFKTSAKSFKLYVLPNYQSSQVVEVMKQDRGCRIETWLMAMY